MKKPPPDQSSLQSSEWERIAASSKFHALLRRKRQFIVPTTIFFIVYYFALPVMVGYFPEIMSRPVLGPVNIAYLFALSQFVVAWLIAWRYVRAADRFDQLAQEIKGAESHLENPQT
jgi:uncharacterized membrane protein (DUF485 family)